MVNINKLKGKIVEKGLTVGKLAGKIGIDRSTLYRKLGNNGESLTIRDANLISEALDLTPQEATDIFFTQVVA
ncbi:helix-turn-helix transcriptional regulator [Bacillus badius]|uniref:helix-turn-helix domain-containing protein n=1 Tax=Bacillus badius TaxID=1455 RepID=UPI001CC0546E|nr:helix-turn-helix transcriptional regulator [Bacillus badius]UAT29547.1 helix-turn-helix transcriptional regulator [Bacillus badius]